MDSTWERRRSIWLQRTHLIGGGTIAGLVGLGIFMAMTNPDQSAYDTFTTQRLAAFLRENVCAEAPETFNLRHDCLALIQNNRSQLQEFVSKNTYRRNFVFFSVYTTELSVAPFVPTYRVQTIGVFNNFYIYDATQQ